MKFDTLAQRIIQENQPQSTDQQAALDSHARAEARRGAKNMYIQFTSPHGDEIAKKIDDAISQRSYTDINDPIGLHRYHKGENFKVTHLPTWDKFKDNHKLSQTDYKVTHSPDPEKPSASDKYMRQQDQTEYQRGPMNTKISDYNTRQPNMGRSGSR